MKNIFFWVIFILNSYASLFAQSPSIVITHPETACLNRVQKIQVTINGAYAGDNKFSLQIRKGDNLPVISEIPAELVDGRIEVVHSDSALSLLPYVQVRIVTTSPKTESNWNNVIIHSRGSVHLSLSGSDTINVGEDLLLRFTAFSSSTAMVTLNDSSYYTISSRAGGFFDSYQPKGTNVSTPFYIAHAENVCGAMQVSGQVKATINPTAIRVLSVIPEATCEGSEIRVSFSTSGPALPAGTSYRLRIMVYQQETSDAKTVEVPARLENNVLVARFPTDFNLTRRSEYKLRIVADNPALLGPDTDYRFIAYPQAGAGINTSSRTIEIGEKTLIGLTFSGMAPYSATLQDGTVIDSRQIHTEAELRPKETTSYSVKSVTTGCGTEQVAEGRTMVVTVKSGIAIDATEGEKAFCAGSPARIKILSNAGLNQNTTFTVNAVINNQTAYSFPAEKSGEYLEFNIPVLSPDVDYSLSYDHITAFYISTTNPSYQSAFIGYHYTIRSKPDMTILPEPVLTYNAPSPATLRYGLRGNGPFEIEDADGRVYKVSGSSWSPDIYVNKSQDFKLKSISNSCFKNESFPDVSLIFDTVGADPGIYMHPLDRLVCRDDSVEISFMKTGTFNPDNVFHIEGYADCCTFQTLATVTTNGKYKVRIPTGQPNIGHFRFRIRSTNPKMETYPVEIQMQKPPAGLEIRPVGTTESPAEYLQGQKVALWMSGGDGPLSSFVYSNGVDDYTHNVDTSGSEAEISPPVGAISTYTIKSVANRCGSFPVDLTTHIRVLPYQISISPGESGFPLTACQNGSLTVPFVVLDGNAAKATFTLQLAPYNTSTFTDLATSETIAPFTTILPGSIATGRYRMRVVSSEGSVSNSVELVIGGAPSATLSATATDPILLYPGETTSTRVSFSGTAPWTMIFENSRKETTDSNPYMRYISATRQQDFFLISVYNRCGYGPVSGKVSVKVRPVLNAWRDVEEVCTGSDVLIRYQLQGDAELENDYIVFQLVGTQSGEITSLDSTRVRAGSVLLKIPSDLKGDVYQLRSVVKSYNLSTTLSMTIKTRVNISISGNTVINPGESTRLRLQSNKPVNEAIHYRLSDGQSGTFYGGGANAEFYVKVSPTETTNYIIVSADNGCGEGEKSGSAIVEVNPVSERSVTATKWEPYENSAFCLGDAILVYYSQTGNFSAGNTMMVQFSDTTGQNFKTVTTTGTASPLKAEIPNDFFPGKDYRVRVVASDQGTGSGAYEYPLSPGVKATARFASESVITDDGESPGLVLAFTGTGSWEFDIGSSIGMETYYAGSAIDTVYLRDNPLPRYYKILRVANRCGTGKVEKPDEVIVEVILGKSEEVDLQVIAAPNPAESYLKITFPDTAEKKIRLLNAAGTTMLEMRSSLREEELAISSLPSGVYFLSIEGNYSRSVHKIIKR